MPQIAEDVDTSSSCLKTQICCFHSRFHSFIPYETGSPAEEAACMSPFTLPQPQLSLQNWVAAGPKPSLNLDRMAARTGLPHYSIFVLFHKNNPRKWLSSLSCRCLFLALGFSASRLGIWGFRHLGVIVPLK